MRAANTMTFLVLTARTFPKFKVNGIDGRGMLVMLIVIDEVVQWQRYRVGKVFAKIPCITHVKFYFKKNKRKRIMLVSFLSFFSLGEKGSNSYIHVRNNYPKIHYGSDLGLESCFVVENFKEQKKRFFNLWMSCERSNKMSIYRANFNILSLDIRALRKVKQNRPIDAEPLRDSNKIERVTLQPLQKSKLGPSLLMLVENDRM